MPDRSHHSLPQKLRRYRIDERLYTLIIAAIIGLLSGYGAVLFRFVIKMAQYVFYRSTEDILNFAHTLPPFAIVVIPALGGLLVGLIVHFGAREAKGHGVPEVMEAVALRDGRMRKRVAGVKILASAICIGSGGSVGREGPIVQIGSSLASTVSQVLDIARVHLQCPHCRCAFCLGGAFGGFRPGLFFTGGAFIRDSHHHIKALFWGFSRLYHTRVYIEFPLGIRDLPIPRGDGGSGGPPFHHYTVQGRGSF